MPGRGVFASGKEAAAETKANHEVMDLVRENPELSPMVFKLHEAGRSWPDAKAAVEANTKPAQISFSGDVLSQRGAGSIIRTTFEQPREPWAVRNSVSRQSSLPAWIWSFGFSLAGSEGLRPYAATFGFGLAGSERLRPCAATFGFSLAGSERLRPYAATFGFGALSSRRATDRCIALSH
jgi:hypothetical protein